MPTTTLAKFAAGAVSRAAKKASEDIVLEIHNELHNELAVEVVRNTPVASGEMKSSWRFWPARRVELQKRGRSLIYNAARHAGILEGGRRRGPSGRMLGSTQAPRGIAGPEVKALKKRQRAINREAARTVTRRLK